MINENESKLICKIVPNNAIGFHAFSRFFKDKISNLSNENEMEMLEKMVEYASRYVYNVYNLDSPVYVYLKNNSNPGSNNGNIVEKENYSVIKINIARFFQNSEIEKLLNGIFNDNNDIRIKKISEILITIFHEFSHEKLKKVKDELDCLNQEKYKNKACKVAIPSKFFNFLNISEQMQKALYLASSEESLATNMALGIYIAFLNKSTKKYSADNNFYSILKSQINSMEKYQVTATYEQKHAKEYIKENIQELRTALNDFKKDINNIVNKNGVLSEDYLKTLILDFNPQEFDEYAKKNVNLSTMQGIYEYTNSYFSISNRLYLKKIIIKTNLAQVFESLQDKIELTKEKEPLFMQKIFYPQIMKKWATMISPEIVNQKLDTSLCPTIQKDKVEQMRKFFIISDSKEN